MDVRTACLGALSRGGATGYELKKLFEEGPFGHFFSAGYGSIYPALARLCREGLATVATIEEPGRPVRKSYSITPAGRAAFERMLLEQPADDRLKSEWIFVAYFADSMPPALLDRRLRERIDWYRERLEALEACDRESLRDGERFVLDLGVAVYRAAARYIEEQGPSLVAASRRRTGAPKAAE